MTYSLHTLTDAAPAAAPRSGLARFAHETALVLGAVALVFWLLAMASHSPFDPAFSTSGDGAPLRNWGGRLGACAASGGPATPRRGRHRASSAPAKRARCAGRQRSTTRPS
ncbi:MAG: hypothetical protein EOO30_14410, partial [Comamonadaceae bacterium]